MQPYPSHLVQRVTLEDGSQVTLRPIRPEDAEIEQAFVRNLSDEARYFRFMDTLRELPPNLLSQFTQVDYEKHMALIAVTERDGRQTEVAVARYVVDDDGRQCEFAIVVADGWQRKGLGSELMRALMAAARAAGVRVMHGNVLAGNQKMLRLMHRLGFTARHDENDPRTIRVETML